MNGQARRHFLPLIPIWRLLWRQIGSLTVRSRSVLRRLFMVWTRRAAGGRRRPLAISRWTGLCQMTLQTFRRSWAVRKWTSLTERVKRRWIWSTRHLSRPWSRGMPTAGDFSIQFQHTRSRAILTGQTRRITACCSKWRQSTEHRISRIISTRIWSLRMSAACVAGCAWTCASCARKRAVSSAQGRAQAVWR